MVVGYGVVVAMVDNEAVKVFSPHEILDIAVGSNSSAVKKAYRDLSRKHHPDKGGDASTFHLLAKAYKALSDPVSQKNYELYGHPDGPQTATVSFGLPTWLLNPEGTTAVVMVLMYLGMFVGICWYTWKWFNEQTVKAEAKSQSMSVAGMDVQHLSMGLSRKSTRIDVLWWIATTPENVVTAKRTIAEIEKIKKEREGDTGGPDLSGGGWANDGDAPEDKARRLREDEERKAIARMTKGKEMLSTEKIEGVDEGVIGIEWVRGVLEKKGAWPPKIPCLTEGSSSYMGALPPGPDGRTIDPLASSPVRRNMIMMVARMHSMALNTHPDLQKAAKEGKIDGRYFQESLKFRMKTSLLLEASLRVASQKKSAELARTVVETVAMYKIGVEDPTSTEAVNWFRDAVQMQYGQGNTPGIVVHKAIIETEDEDEVATNDVTTLTLDIERTHAEAFTKQKVMLCQKQGLDPNQELSKYREGWWIVVSAKRDGDDEKLTICWPVIVQRIDRKRTTVGIKFKAPAEPGNYEFRIDVKSQEFLGCDAVKKVNVKVISESDVKKGDFMTNEEEGEGKEKEIKDAGSSDEEDGDAVIVSSPKNEGKGDGELRQRKPIKPGNE